LYFMYGLIIAMGLVIYIVALTNWIPGTENHDYIPPLLYALPFLALLVLYGFSNESPKGRVPRACTWVNVVIAR
jgi:polyferredoxin